MQSNTPVPEEFLNDIKKKIFPDSRHQDFRLADYFPINNKNGVIIYSYIVVDANSISIEQNKILRIYVIQNENNEGADRKESIKNDFINKWSISHDVLAHIQQKNYIFEKEDNAKWYLGFYLYQVIYPITYMDVENMRKKQWKHIFYQVLIGIHVSRSAQKKLDDFNMRCLYVNSKMSVSIGPRYDVPTDPNSFEEIAQLAPEKIIDPKNSTEQSTIFELGLILYQMKFGAKFSKTANFCMQKIASKYDQNKKKISAFYFLLNEFGLDKDAKEYYETRIVERKKESNSSEIEELEQTLINVQVKEPEVFGTDEIDSLMGMCLKLNPKARKSAHDILMNCNLFKSFKENIEQDIIYEKLKLIPENNNDAEETENLKKRQKSGSKASKCGNKQTKTNQ